MFLTQEQMPSPHLLLSLIIGHITSCSVPQIREVIAQSGEQRDAFLVFELQKPKF